MKTRHSATKDEVCRFDVHRNCEDSATKDEVCRSDVHRNCEKFSNIGTFPVKEQSYNFEAKKIYELEMKTRPKKIKTDDSIKDCKEQLRVICNQWDIQPLCDTQERMVHTHEINRK